ncbi:unnamed protein product, partial [Polarella glacialis]
VAVQRADVPGGWGQKIKLKCTALAVKSFVPAFVEIQAPTPIKLELKDVTASSITAKYSLGYIQDIVATCDCAALVLELRANGTDDWFRVPGRNGGCMTIGSSCIIDEVLSDTMYFARLKMSCSNSAVDSGYIMSDYAITQPGCAWSTHTGLLGYADDVYECTDDGITCNMTDDCCVAHGGRLRCPRMAPVMCNNERDCADSQERCCVATADVCNNHGGVRECEIPAHTPTLTQCASLA